MATSATPGTAASSLPAGGGTSTAGLSEWAAPYITNYLGKAQALSEMPYQTYGGPLTAGESGLQTKAFQGIGNLTVGNKGTYTPVGGSFTDRYSYPSGTGAPVDMPYIGGGGGMAAATGQGPKTEDAWNRFSSMAFFAPGTDMEKAKADFMSGGGGGMAAATGQGRDPTSAELSNMQADYFARKARGEPVASEPPGMDGRLGYGGARQGTMGGGGTGFAQPRSVAEEYMNPYLQQALDPQLRELQRQSDIQRVADAGRLTQAGAFGGSRQAIMESEGRRNLLGKQSDVLGQGYATAYDKAMQQFNADQARKIQEQQFGADFGLRGLAAEQDLYRNMLNAGAVQRGITSEGIAADLGEFEKQRDFPYKQVQFQRDMISGLPTGSVTNSPAQLSGIAQLISSAGGIDKLLKSTGQGDLSSLLKNLGLNLGGGEVV